MRSTWPRCGASTPSTTTPPSARARRRPARPARTAVAVPHRRGTRPLGGRGSGQRGAGDHRARRLVLGMSRARLGTVASVLVLVLAADMPAGRCAMVIRAMYEVGHTCEGDLGGTGPGAAAARRAHGRLGGVERRPRADRGTSGADAPPSLASTADHRRPGSTFDTLHRVDDDGAEEPVQKPERSLLLDRIRQIGGRPPGGVTLVAADRDAALHRLGEKRLAGLVQFKRSRSATSTGNSSTPTTSFSTTSAAPASRSPIRML